MNEILLCDSQCHIISEAQATFHVSMAYMYIT